MYFLRISSPRDRVILSIVWPNMKTSVTDLARYREFPLKSTFRAASVTGGYMRIEYERRTAAE